MVTPDVYSRCLANLMSAFQGSDMTCRLSAYGHRLRRYLGSNHSVVDMAEVKVVWLGYCRRQKGIQDQREKECLQIQLSFKITFIYNMVTMGLFLTVSKRKIRLSSGD